MDRDVILDQLLDGMDQQVERHRIMAGTVQTHYLVAGNGPPLLLVHGAGAGAIQWYRVIDLLAKHFKIVAPDVVGYGESDKPSATYDKPFFAAWLVSFLDALELQPVGIVGSSQGGMIAVQFILDHPERVERVALIDAMGFADSAPPIPFGALLGMVWLNTLPSTTAFGWYRRYLVHDANKLDSALASYALEVMKMPGAKRPFWHSIRKGKGQGVQPFAMETLAQIHHPVLILWGEADRLFGVSPARHAQAALPNSQLHMVPGAGHLAILEQPEALAARLIPFFRGDIALS